MRVVEIIAKKRDGAELEAGEIGFVVDGVMSGSIADAQVAALLMAVVFRGLSERETAALTGCMLHSGGVLDVSRLDRPVADKHSTGGIGDKTSLVLAPIAAEAGLAVPMISGRALGHTGGTLDKLESIPGFRTDLSLVEFGAVLAEHGASFIGQTPEIAPADRKLYALRDATGTVPSMGLIVSSIMSKKLAESLDALVLDVKAGSGAFMKTDAEARALASAMCAVGARHGVKTEAVITRMDGPLGRAVGNALEVAECVEVLQGGGPRDVVELSIELAARMVVLGGLADTLESARDRARSILSSGAALERFRRIVAAQGGDPRALDDPRALGGAPEAAVVRASRSGYVTSIAGEEVGWAGMELGVGRASVGGAIDAGVGFVFSARVGDAVREGEGLGVVHARDEASAERAARRVAHAYAIADEAPHIQQLILDSVVGRAHD